MRFGRNRMRPLIRSPASVPRILIRSRPRRVSRVEPEADSAAPWTTPPSRTTTLTKFFGRQG